MKPGGAGNRPARSAAKEGRRVRPSRLACEVGFNAERPDLGLLIDRAGPSAATAPEKIEDGAPSHLGDPAAATTRPSAIGRWLRDRSNRT